MPQELADATFVKILFKLRRELGKVAGGEGNVRVLARRGKVPNLTGELDILLRPKGFGVDPNAVAAAGRNFTPLRRVVGITIRTRNAEDEVASDLSWLTKTDVGHLLIEEKVANVVQLFFPTDDDTREGTPLCIEPPRIINSMEPERNMQSADGKWGESELLLEVIYDAGLQTTADFQ